jgi:hypothetical protein
VHKVYVTTIAIGAKLLSSFNAVMRAAEARLKRLRALAKSVATALKFVTGGLAGLTAAIAAFGVGKIFQEMFSGATEEAMKAAQTMKSLQVLLLKNNQIRKGGMGMAQKQTEMIYANSAALEETGVLADKVFNSMARGLAMWGVPTRQIMDAQGAMGDFLVTMRGANATAEDGAELARDFGRAIMTGQGRAMRKWGIAIDATWAKEHKTYQSRFESLMKMIAFTKDANKAQRDTPIGKIVLMRNELDKTRRLIGNELLPIEAKMAALWLKAIPIIRPYVLAGIDKLGAAFDWVVDKLRKWDWQKIWHDFTSAMNTAGWQWNHFWIGFKAGLDKIGEGIKVMAKICEFNISTFIVKPFKAAVKWAEKLVGAMDKLKLWGGKALGGPDWINKKAYPVDAGAAMAAVMPAPKGPLVGALADVRKQYANEMANPEVIRAMYQRTAQEVGTGTDPQSVAAQQAFQEELLNRAAARKQSLSYAIHDPHYYPEPVFNKSVSARVAKNFDAIRAQVVAGSNVAKWATGNASQGVGFGGGPKVAHYGGEDFGIEKSDIGWVRDMQKANPQIAQYQSGGIARRPQLATLAEHGPEAILPLATARLRSLLGGRGTGSGVNFAPQITIHGDASESEQRALDSRLRSLARDFIKQFIAAQNQSRRLSYEGGYS